MNNYNKLTTYEKKILLAELQHCLQTDDLCYLKVRAMIKEAKTKGKFDNVTFHPEKDLKIVA